MNKKLFSDGTEVRDKGVSHIKSLVKSLALILLGYGCLYYFSSLFEDFFGTPYLLFVIYGFYGIPVTWLAFFRYFKRKLPIVELKDNKLITRKGLLRKEIFRLNEIKKIETELNDDEGIQLIIHFKDKFPARYTAEIPVNSCTDGQFAGFIKKYKPEIEVETQTRILHKAEHGDTPFTLVSRNTTIPESDEIDNLWKRYDTLKASEQYEEAIAILKILQKKGVIVHGYLGEYYLNGWHFPQNYQLAYEEFQRGIQRECYLSRLNMGVMYFYGYIVETSYEKALKIFEEVKFLRLGIIYSYIGFCKLYLDYPKEQCKLNFLKAISLQEKDGYFGLGNLAKLEGKRIKAFKLFWKSESVANS